jgi:DNA uptake protein ComE-like DNA-binding protein
MPTPAEQKALTFLAIVILLGGAVRIVRGGVPAGPAATPMEHQALARQAVAASSVATTSARKIGAKGRKGAQTTPRRRYAGAKFDSTGLLIEGTGVSSAPLSPTGFPPPSPRIDVGLRGARPAAEGQPVGPKALVDLDLADTAQIGRLPRVGPALARRIVANRDSLGAFGALPALRRVKGVGPATLERLAGLVTFSGQARR